MNLNQNKPTLAKRIVSANMTEIVTDNKTAESVVRDAGSPGDITTINKPYLQYKQNLNNICPLAVPHSKRKNKPRKCHLPGRIFYHYQSSVHPSSHNFVRPISATLARPVSEPALPTSPGPLVISSHEEFPLLISTPHVNALTYPLPLKSPIALTRPCIVTIKDVLRHDDIPNPSISIYGQTSMRNPTSIPSLSPSVCSSTTPHTASPNFHRAGIPDSPILSGTMADDVDFIVQPSDDRSSESKCNICMVSSVSYAKDQPGYPAHTSKHNKPYQGADTVKFQEGNTSPEINIHSANSPLSADKSKLCKIMSKLPIRWPSMDQDEQWSKLDSAVLQVLPLGGSIDSRVGKLEDIVYENASTLFGVYTSVSKPNPCNNRRKRTLFALVNEKNDLLKQLEFCDVTQSHGLHDLLMRCREKLRKLRRIERKRSNRWKYRQAARRFRSNPYEAGKSVLDPPSSFTLNISKEALDVHKSSVASDPLRTVPLQPLDGLPSITKPKHSFPTGFFKERDFEKVVLSRRNGSAPGLNMISYRVYKKCTSIRRFLYQIIQSCYNTKYVPLQWRAAREAYIPKVKVPNPKNIKDFRPLALLNVEGKIFFSLLSRRLFTHIVTNNKFIDKSIQKGCMEGTPGCWEHMSMVWAALREARQVKKSVATIWLDIANAYGSIPHELIFFALARYGVSQHCIDLVRTYYSGLWTKCFSDTSDSSWTCHQRGIFAGCTASIILFLSGMNVIIEYTIVTDARRFVTSAKIVLPLARAFMDDLNLMAESVSDAQKALTRCTIALEWARMEFRPDKSRSFVIIKGRSMNVSPFAAKPIPGNIISMSATSVPVSTHLVESLVTSNCIPSIHNNPIKFLGRIINGSLCDRRSTDELATKLNDGLMLIDKSKHCGAEKLWILHHLLIPRIRWPLLIYEVPLSRVVILEQKISTFIRKWLGLHRTTTNLCFYSSSSPCPLPLSSLTSILKAQKVSGHLQLRDSSDPLISSSVPVLKAGVFVVEDAVKDAESALKFETIRGATQTNKAGLGINKPLKIPKVGTKPHRDLISDTVKQLQENHNYSKAVSMAVQGQWTKWVNYVRRDLRWSDVLAMPQNLMKFCLGATFDTLPTPANLHRWKMVSEAACCLCNASNCTMAHILGGCKFSLNQDRFTFRHDSVLQELFNTVKQLASSVTKPAERGFHGVKFVKAGNWGKRRKKKKDVPTGILHLASDWTAIVDLSSEYIFPVKIALTQDRPDIVVFSEVLRRVILIELTVPCEENFEYWHHEKLRKYVPIEMQARVNGWGVDIFAVEVGARGYCANSTLYALRTLGFSAKISREVGKRLADIAMKASFAIYLSRETRVWDKSMELISDKSASPCGPNSQPNQCHPVLASSTVTKSPAAPLVQHHIYDKPKRVASVAGVVDKRVANKGRLPVGLHNKGNSCYANAVLQALSATPEFWSVMTESNSKPNRLVSSFLRIMCDAQRVTVSIDPYHFLEAFQNSYRKFQTSPTFKWNRQQDASEVLQHLLREIGSISPQAYERVAINVVTVITCHTCHDASTNEVTETILCCPIASTIQACVNKYQLSEELTGENQWFCHGCQRKCDATKSYYFAKASDVLIIQLNRFTSFQNTFYKSLARVDINLPLKLCIRDQSRSDEVSFSSDYLLRACISHDGKLDRGHYFAHVRVGGAWYKCNDTAVTLAQSLGRLRTDSYLLFYVRC